MKIDPLDRRTTFTYDEVGNQTVKLDPRGNSVTTVYDAANQLVGHYYPDGRRHTFTYDEVGNRTVAADSTGRTTTVYDQRNSSIRVTNPDGKTVTYAWDGVGRPRRRRSCPKSTHRWRRLRQPSLASFASRQRNSLPTTRPQLGRKTFLAQRIFLEIGPTGLLRSMPGSLKRT